MSRKSVVNVKELQELSKDINVNRIGKSLYTAGHGNDINRHLVRILKTEYGVKILCNCNWQHYGGEGCVHSMAVVRNVLARKGKIPSFWLSEEIARKQHHKVIKIGSSLYVTTRRGEIIDKR